LRKSLKSNWQENKIKQSGSWQSTEMALVLSVTANKNTTIYFRGIWIIWRYFRHFINLLYKNWRGSMKFVLLNPGWKALLCNFELQDDYKLKKGENLKAIVAYRKIVS
jgi:hypothetical protein